MTTIELKQVPELKRIVTTAFPGYKKHNVFLSVFHEMDINSYWDGGSKDTYVLMDLETLTRKTLPTSTHPYYDVARHVQPGSNDYVSIDGRGNITLKMLPANYAIIKGGTFCGKPVTAHVFVNADNMPKYLTA